MARPKEINLQFKFFDDGLCQADPSADVGTRYSGKAPHDIRNGWKQIADSMDFMLHLKKPRWGSNGFADTFTTTLRGLGTYLRQDGTEYLLAVSGGILYSVDTSTGALTALYTLTGTGEAWMQDYVDKCFVCNGTKTIKVEGTTVYQVGIDAPTGVTSELVAGGTLPDGVYQIYVTYTRKVGDVKVLHSTGQLVTSRTCGTGNNTIRITFAASSDSQVTDVSVWMTDAGGSIQYYYGGAVDTAGTVDIDGSVAPDTTLVYSVEAHYNCSVPAFEYIKTFNNYLYGSVGGVLYRSLQLGNAYDLERFDTSATGNNATYPFECKGIFAIGADLFLNTPGGIIKIPYGDYNMQIDIKQGFFDYPRTVVEWNQGLLGLTKRGVRFFDGEKMNPVDISLDIKPIIDKIVTGATTDCMPAGCVVKDNNRTEYHLGYRDIDVGGVCNNRQIILNLDTLYFTDQNRAHAAWEPWSVGFNYMTTMTDETWYGAQSHESKSIIYQKYSSDRVDKNVYIGVTLETSKAYGWSLTTPTMLPSMKGRIRCLTVWIYVTMNRPLYVKIVMERSPQIVSANYVASRSEGAALFGVARFGIDRFNEEHPLEKKVKLGMNLKGKAVYLQFYQTEADKLFELVDSVLKCSLLEGRFT